MSGEHEIFSEVPQDFWLFTTFVLFLSIVDIIVVV